jgi:hypothetical protein
MTKNESGRQLIVLRALTLIFGQWKQLLLNPAKFKVSAIEFEISYYKSL